MSEDVLAPCLTTPEASVSSTTAETELDWSVISVIRAVESVTSVTLPTSPSSVGDDRSVHADAVVSCPPRR